jgi:Protein of unknown function (DUF4242)
MKKSILMIIPALLATAAFAHEGTAVPKGPLHRYVIERTFPAGALDGLDAAAKKQVNATNARFGVRWLTSYANADKTHTYCIYEGPSEQAVRDAAKANAIPVDSVAEVPVTLSPR